MEKLNILYKILMLGIVALFAINQTDYPDTAKYERNFTGVKNKKRNFETGNR